MGIDVYGNRPKNQRGKYFGLNSAGWHPLATYICEVAPKITAKCRHWHSNDFDGLNGDDSILLADLLQKEIDSGRAERYALQQSEFEPTNERRSLDELMGVRRPTPARGAGDGVVCNSCNGTGYVRPYLVEILQEFAHFLRCCGGFQIG